MNRFSFVIGIGLPSMMLVTSAWGQFTPPSNTGPNYIPPANTGSSNTGSPNTGRPMQYPPANGYPPSTVPAQGFPPQGTFNPPTNPQTLRYSSQPGTAQGGSPQRQQASPGSTYPLGGQAVSPQTPPGRGVLPPTTFPPSNGFQGQPPVQPGFNGQPPVRPMSTLSSAPSTDSRFSPQSTETAGPTPNPNLNLELFEPGKLVAKVGDQTIFYGEILGDLNQVVDQEMPSASDTLKDLRRKELFAQLLPRMVEQKMILADYLRNMPDREERMPEIMKQLDKGFFETEVPSLREKLQVNSLGELDAKLRGMGTSMRNVKHAWKESQIVGFYISDKFKEEKEVTHQEMLDYYQEHISEYEIPARARWEQLMVKYDEFPNRQAARAEIESMGNEVVFGAPLKAVAERRSQGSMAKFGGQHDWTNQGALLDKAVDAQLFELPLNYLSDIIATEEGFHIVRVVEREPQYFRPFTDVQKEIKQKLIGADRRKKIEGFLENLKEEIPVWTILDEEEEPRSAAGGFQLPIR